MLFAILFTFLSSTQFALAMNGVVEVQSGSLRVMRDDGMKVNFYPGRYHSQISLEGGRLFLMIDRLNVRTDATIVLPSGTQIPENGALEIDGFKTGQTFAARGTIRTSKERSANVKDTESCVYQRESWVCGGYGSDYRCEWVSRPVPGFRPVEYFFETRTVALDLQLDSRNGGVSSFSGKDMDRRKLYTFQGNC